MFYFESFHMYGLLFSAIATAALGIILVKRYNLKNINGTPSIIDPSATTSSIRPFAQSEMVYAFLQGIEPKLYKHLGRVLLKVFTAIPELLEEVINEPLTQIVTRFV